MRTPRASANGTATPIATTGFPGSVTSSTFIPGRNAVARASQSLKGVDWFEMQEVRGLVKDGKVSQFQVKVKVGFRILSDDELRSS